MGAVTSNSVRLFMIPDMGHHFMGGNGPSASEFDAESVLEQWREQGKTPDQVVAAHREAGVEDRNVLLCPYPRVVEYRGSGSADDAANFVCRAPV